ncbi:MAG: right-handed parallel beta-helix repeat-containing protein [Candidatus Bipolaricaulota bacterium]|nr:MAG: right-handed parallel beta-helix repeat-containing protein [Candidatus Bipolaricaulota bacterium]
MRGKTIAAIATLLAVLVPAVGWGVTSQTWFMESTFTTQVEEYRIGELVQPQHRVFILVDDPDPIAPVMLVRLDALGSGDFILDYQLFEWEVPGPGTFGNGVGIQLIPNDGPPNTTDGVLEVLPGDTITALYIDPMNPNDWTKATAMAVTGPVDLYEGEPVFANLKGAFLVLETRVTGPLPRPLGALDAAPGVVFPTIVVREDYDHELEDDWPLNLDVANLTLMSGAVPAWIVLEPDESGLPAILVEADNVTVDGFTIRSTDGANAALHVPDAQGGTILRNNDFKPAVGSRGVVFSDDAADTIVENNRFYVDAQIALGFVGNADGSQILDNHIERLTPGNLGYGIGFLDSCNWCVVSGNEIYGTDAFGIRFVGSCDDSLVAHNVVSEVTGLNPYPAPFPAFPYPIPFGILFDTSLDRTEILANVVEDVAGVGIGFYPWAGERPPNPFPVYDLTIADNDVSLCDDVGILLAPTALYDTLIASNYVHENNDGVLIWAPWRPPNHGEIRNLHILGNTIQQNGIDEPDPGAYFGFGRVGFGILAAAWPFDGPPNSFYSENIVIHGNEFLENEVGLALDPGRRPYRGSGLLTDAFVTGNLFHENETAVLLTNPSHEIHGNDFVDDVIYGIDARDIGNGVYGPGLPLGTRVDATGNWWGDPTGPFHSSNPGGLGDAVSNHVLFDPWGAMTQLGTEIVFGSPTIAPGDLGEVIVSVTTDEMVDFQVGPVGEVTFSDPTVIDVVDVVGIFPYEVSAFTVNPTTDAVRFAANLLPGEDPAAGPAISIVVDAVGFDGDSCTVDLTLADVFRDAALDPLPYGVTPGLITLSGGGPAGLDGDTNGDGFVDITDARLAAEHAIEIIDLTVPNPPLWTVGAFERADVAPPDGIVDITDARWIAEASIGLRTLSAMAASTFGPSALGTAQLEINPTGQLIISGSTAELSDIQGTLYFDPAEVTITDVVGLNGFQLLASWIDNTAGEVRFAAAKLSGAALAEGAAILFETADDASLAVLDVDVLRDVRGRDIAVEYRTSVQGQVLSFGCSPNPVDDVHTTTFSVKGTLPVDEIRVRIYNFSGVEVFDSGWGANDLDWHLENEAGDVLANGVYYYRIEVKFVGQDEPVVTGIGKVAVYR